MDWNPIATAGSGAVAAIMNYFTNKNTNDTNIALQESANAANRQLAQEQRQWDLEMWQRQNAYNDPSAQMARLKAAGINPALAYADGNMMNEAAPAQAAAGSRDAAARVQGYYMDPLMMAQIANLNAQTDKTESEAEAVRTKLPEEVQQLQNQNKQIQTQIENLNVTIQKQREEIANLREERKLTIQKQITESFGRTIASQDFERKCKETDAAVKKMMSDIGVNEADRDLKRSVMALNWQSYAYNAQANAYRLLGLQLDNELKHKTSTLYDDQHTINKLQAGLLGYQVQEGYINYQQNKLAADDFSGKNGKFYELGAKISYNLTWSLGQLLTPVRGILSIH